MPLRAAPAKADSRGSFATSASASHHATAIGDVSRNARPCRKIRASRTSGTGLLTVPISGSVRSRYSSRNERRHRKARICAPAILVCGDNDDQQPRHDVARRRRGGRSLEPRPPRVNLMHSLSRENSACRHTVATSIRSVPWRPTPRVAKNASMRPRRLLRQLEEQARDQAFSRDRTSDHALARAGRDLGLVLHRRAYFRPDARGGQRALKRSRR